MTETIIGVISVPEITIKIIARKPERSADDDESALALKPVSRFIQSKGPSKLGPVVPTTI